MSILGKFLAPRPLDYGEPREGFLAPKPEALTWRHWVLILVVAVVIPRLAGALGLTALWRRYVPEWGDGLPIVAIGLVFVLLPILRPTRGTAVSRRDDIIIGSVLVGIGAAFSLLRT